LAVQLPGECEEVSSIKEYGEDILQIQVRQRAKNLWSKHWLDCNCVCLLPALPPIAHGGLMQKSAIKPGAKVVLVDDLIATGGTLKSAVELIKKVACVVMGAL
jgi:hypothetical protein